MADFAGFSPRAVLSFFYRQAQDASHLGWYGPEGQFCSYFAAALVVECGSGMALLSLLVDAVRTVSPSLSAGPPSGAFCRFTPTSWPQSSRPRSSSTTVACSWSVLLVTMHLALFFLFLSSGPRCSASWPVWTRMTVTRYILCHDAEAVSHGPDCSVDP